MIFESLFPISSDIKRLIEYCDKNIFKEFNNKSDEYYHSRDYNYISCTKTILTIEVVERLSNKRAMGSNWFISSRITYEIELTTIKDKINNYFSAIEKANYEKELLVLKNEINDIKSELKNRNNSSSSSSSNESGNKCNYPTWSDGSRKYKKDETNDYGYIIGDSGKWIDPYKEEKNSGW